MPLLVREDKERFLDLDVGILGHGVEAGVVLFIFSAWLSCCYSIAITTGRNNLMFQTLIVGFILGRFSSVAVRESISGEV